MAKLGQTILIRMSDTEQVPALVTKVHGGQTSTVDAIALHTDGGDARVNAHFSVAEGTAIGQFVAA